MRLIESESSTGSPVKHVDFQRGNSRVVPSLALSPRASLLRRRPGLTPQKYRAAQQQSRKPSNPIMKNRLDALGGPKLDPPTDDPNSLKGDEDEWQDVDPQQTNPGLGERNRSRISPQPSAYNSGSPRQSKPTGQSYMKKENDPSRLKQQEYRKPRGSEQTEQESRSQIDSKMDDTNITEDNSTNTSTTTSFLGFSPSAAKANFMRRLGRHGQRFKPSNWRTRWTDSPTTPEEKLNRNAQSPGYNYYPAATGSSFKSFWMDPSTPGLLALYLQVGFNLAMVAALIYAIFIFYLTIRNDVNLKVEEYSVDIVDQIAKCSFDYIRNNCEPSKRVPGMEAACQQWERCMQRDPKEVGRAKVSAETFGTIIEAFLRPIGLKSMIFLIGVFAGSFLLINAVFASRIGPRFSGDFAQSNILGQPHMPAPQPPPSAPHYQPQVSYAPPPPPPQSSFLYSPSPRMASPRHRQSSIHATLQSSPIHHQAYYPY